MATRTCLYQSHTMRTVQFPDGWVAACSCTEYMSAAYKTAATAMHVATREHRMAPSLAVPQ